MPTEKKPSDSEKWKQIVNDTHAQRDKRQQSYREQSLSIYPRICARCAREFSGKNLQELTVHHKDHNHDNNPADGSNWELLCLYCHDNEHAKYRVEQEEEGGSFLGGGQDSQAKHKPFADLKNLLKDKD